MELDEAILRNFYEFGKDKLAPDWITLRTGTHFRR
jgi:hypothetical protein